MDLTKAPSEPAVPAAPVDVLADVEARFLTAAIQLAPELGWSGRLPPAAARRAGLSDGEVALIAPEGARDLAALLSQRHDAAALKTLSRHDLASLKIRERIRLAVETRVEAAMADEAAVRRATAFLALPVNAGLGLRLAWRTADRLWRWAGDTATDENHYSKRAILSGVLAATLAARLSGGPGAARRTLERAIDRVMEFEKWKARAPRPSQWLRDAAAHLGARRYGAGASGARPGADPAG